MHPIIKALRHHKTAAILLTLEIALTLAIVANALLVVGDRVNGMQVSTGLPDDQLVWASTRQLDDTLAASEKKSRVEANLVALRSIPGVVHAARINSMPLSRSGYILLCIYRRPDGDPGDANRVCGMALYMGTPGFMETLGLHVSRGRTFDPQDYGPFDLFGDGVGAAPPAIVSRSLADRLWPGENPLGKPIYLDKTGKLTSRVVGVSDHLLNPVLDPSHGNDENILMPVGALTRGNYMMRVAPGAADRVVAAVNQALARTDSMSVVTQVSTLGDTVRDYFRDDRAMVWLLLGVVASLLLLTGLGIFGLTGFWVQERVRIIGIRRALGATRRDIRTYFQLENLAIVTAGVVLGAITAVMLNLWLMLRYELPRLPFVPLAGGIALLYVIGQLAVWQPARRACRVPPVAATRL